MAHLRQPEPAIQQMVLIGIPPSVQLLAGVVDRTNEYLLTTKTNRF